jgi:NitT/TauT family transport system substrate-binding protein
MKLAADKNGIKFKSISYVPGSEVRAGALIQGNIKASILDATNRKIVMDRAPGKFAILPIEGVSATDDALFASPDVLEKNAKAIDALVESMLQTMRDISARPEAAAELREVQAAARSAEAARGRHRPYFKEAVEAKSLSVSGGSPEAAKTDLTFFILAGQVTGDPASLKVEDFWAFGPLDRAKAKLGM